MNTDLNRFLEAQESVYEQALAEIKSGRKKSHWMWYIFPQFAGLGYSDTAKFYAIGSVEEAKAYLNHPVLGTRLREITQELLNAENSNAHRIFGSPDDLKLRSSMTLFSLVDQTPDFMFKKVLDHYFNGQSDEKTLTLVNQ